MCSEGHTAWHTQRGTPLTLPNNISLAKHHGTRQKQPRINRSQCLLALTPKQQSKVGDRLPESKMTSANEVRTPRSSGNKRSKDTNCQASCPCSPPWALTTLGDLFQCLMRPRCICVRVAHTRVPAWFKPCSGTSFHMEVTSPDISRRKDGYYLVVKLCQYNHASSKAKMKMSWHAEGFGYQSPLQMKWD